MKPHGNSKKASPFFRTAKKTKERMQELASSSTPMKVIEKITDELGGELEAIGAAFLPRDRRQVKNI